MTDNAKRKFIAKCLRRFAVEYFGFDAKYKPEAREKYDILMNFAKELEKAK